MASAEVPSIRDVKSSNGFPTENLVRVGAARAELRVSDDDDAPPTLFGHFAVFDRFTEIDSFFEGHFLERIAPGAFKKTFKEQRGDIKVLFNHGHDPSVGDKPLGPIDELREDDEGAYYEVPLIDTSYNRDLIPALENDLLGASFRFQVMKEQFEEEPDESDQNPHGLPERTLLEVRLFEFGPVTFPAYADATAGVRSFTDERIITGLYSAFPERMGALFEYAHDVATNTQQDRAEPEKSAHSSQQSALSSESRTPRARGELVLPSPPRRRGGVLPSTEEEDQSCRPLRLP